MIFDGHRGRFHVPPLSEGTHYVAVAAGHAHSILLRNDGKAVAIDMQNWGIREMSELSERVGVRYIPYGAAPTVGGTTSQLEPKPKYLD